ncbi:hypothetical protein [Terasakiella pusilla]|uniref:hypothetical protein n=1 Tax=Terasakiella pusilla TaxID=64973 RepID=UPI003AA8E7D6
MSIKRLVNKTARDIISVSGADASKEGIITEVIQTVFLDVMKKTDISCVDAVNLCCSPDQDLAHKIAEQLKQKEELLISSLMSLR